MAARSVNRELSLPRCPPAGRTKRGSNDRDAPTAPERWPPAVLFWATCQPCWHISALFYRVRGLEAARAWRRPQRGPNVFPAWAHDRQRSGTLGLLMTLLDLIHFLPGRFRPTPTMGLGLPCHLQEQKTCAHGLCAHKANVALWFHSFTHSFIHASIEGLLHARNWPGCY